MDGIKTGVLLYRNFDSAFEKQLSNTKSVRKIGVTFELKNSVLTATDEDSNSVSVCITCTELPNDMAKMVELFKTQITKTGTSDFYVSDIKIIDESLPFMKISQINELRRNILSDLMEKRLDNYKRLEQKPLNYSPYTDSSVDYRGNVLNSEAKDFYANCSCNVLQSALEASCDIPSGIELMRTKHCLKFATNLCGTSCGKLYLQGDKKKYPLKFDCKNCEMVILSP